MKILIVGVSGGIGHALATALCDRENVDQVIGTYLNTRPQFHHPKLMIHKLDACNEQEIASLCQSLNAIDWIINAVGMLSDDNQQPEKTITTVSADRVLKSIRVNTLPTLLLAKYSKPILNNSQRGIFATISAKVGSISDNRLGGWYSYRMSKAALNMGLKTLSIEWKRSLPNCTVAALHPGTTDTVLSKPYQSNVPIEKLFSPEQTAHYLLAVLDQLQPADSGKFWSWDGSELMW